MSTIKDLYHEQSRLCGADLETSNELVRELPKFNKVIHEDLRRSNSWGVFFPQQKWEDGAAVKRVIVFHETELPDDYSTWQRSDSCGGRSCKWEYQNVRIGQSEHTATLVRNGLRTDNICLEQLRDKFQRKRIVSANLNNFRANANLLLGRHAKWSHAYTATNLVAAPGFPSAAGAVPSGAVPESVLTLAILDVLAQEFKIDQSVPNSGMSDGYELFPMLLGSEMYQNLKHTDDSFKEALFEVSPGEFNDGVLNDEGSKRSRYGNFVPCIVREPDRFEMNWQTGELELVQPKVTVDLGARGEKSIVNPAWQRAEFEAVDFPSRMAGEIHVTMAIGAIGDYKFSPQNYTMQPMWTRCPENVEGNEGFIRGKAERAFVPCYPHYSQRLIVQRPGHDPGRLFQAVPGFAPRHPEQICVLVTGCCQGDSDTELVLTFNGPLPAGFTDGTGLLLKRQGSPDVNVTVTAHVPLSTCEHRYKVTSDGCPLDCGCGEKASLCAPMEPVEICPDLGDCGCGPCGGKDPIEGVADAKGVPDGYASCLVIPGAGADGADGDAVIVTLDGGQQVAGVLTDAAGDVVCFRQTVSALSLIHI